MVNIARTYEDNRQVSRLIARLWRSVVRIPGQAFCDLFIFVL